MALIRSVVKKLMVLPVSISCKRTYYSSWHEENMVEKANHYQEFTKDLWHRRALAGPDEAKPRSKSAFLWNYEAELFAFGKRLGEEFKMETLRRAFLHDSYKPEEIEEEVEEQSDSEAAPTTSNEEFILKGENILNVYVPAYLRYHFPKLPEEGIRTIAAHLCSQTQLAYLAKNLGMVDLTLAANFPYDELTMCNTFKAVVGALEMDSGLQKAEYFVQDFVLTELIDLDVNEMFYVKNPMRILTAILEKSGKSAPESRIIRQSGAFTVTPVHLVGIYVDKQLLGKAPGESIEIAEEMAARDCLKSLWKTNHSRRSPLSFGSKAGRALQLDSWKNRENSSLKEIIDFENDADLLENAFGDEPLQLDEMYAKYKDEIEPALGIVHRRYFKNAFYRGTLCKGPRRPFVRPNVKTI